jgi:amino acid transporter
MADAVRFRLNETDMVHAARLFALSSLRRPKAIVSLLVIFFVCLVLLSAITGIVFPLNPERLAQRWPLVLGASLLPFLMVLVLALLIGPIQARGIYRQQRSLQGEIGLSWTAESLAFESEYGNFAMPWSHFVRVSEDRNTFVLFESDRLYRIIPKRVLDGATESSLRARLATIGS